MSTLIDVAVLLVIITGIIIACEAFTNSIEWLGKLLNLNEGAVGSVLAAVGTALPETIVPIIAITSAYMSGNPGGAAIGEGAIVGAPFMLSTLAMFITGAAIVIFVRQGRRGPEMPVDTVVLGRDLTTFLVVYALGILATFVPDWGLGGWLTVKHFIGFGLIGIYAWYVARTLAEPGELGGDISPLYFARKHDEPPMWRVALQILVALGAIIVGAHFFVERIEHLAELWHVPALVLSLLITPVATELPEKLNSVLWVRVKKDTLALGNLTGAMVFQSCIPVAVGLWMTPWNLSKPSLLSAAIALASGAVLVLYMRRTGKLTPWILMVGGAFYLAFVIGLWWVKA
ncbi:MAG: sodium:calcium antiporter [Candidatus Sericytochromatia bacterium]|nr:sodium:calcium antiporter [Candidatus Tanganyikabacteria bacterium]